MLGKSARLLADDLTRAVCVRTQRTPGGGGQRAGRLAFQECGSRGQLSAGPMKFSDGEGASPRSVRCGVRFRRTVSGSLQPILPVLHSTQYSVQYGLIER